MSSRPRNLRRRVQRLEGIWRSRVRSEDKPVVEILVERMDAIGLDVSAFKVRHEEQLAGNQANSGVPPTQEPIRNLARSAKEVLLERLQLIHDRQNAKG